MNRKIKEIAEQIMKLQTEYEKTHDSALEGKMMEYIKDLSLSELLEVDSYIMETYNLKL